MTVAAPMHARGRAMSALAGANRAGLLIGPFASAALIGLAGASRAAFVAPLGRAAVVLLVTLVYPDPAASVPTAASTRSGSGSVLATLWQRRDVLVKVVLGVSISPALRASRTTIVPLWAVASASMARRRRFWLAWQPRWMPRCSIRAAH